MSRHRRALGLIAAAVAAGALWAANGVDHAKHRLEDLDWLTRAMVVELGDKGGDIEREGIAWVARNRAELWGVPIRTVVRSEAPGRAVWGSRPAAYLQRMREVDPRGSAYQRAFRIVAGVYDGEIPSRIGNRRNFVHPMFSGYASPGGTRILDPVLNRWLPSWAVAREHGGQAMYPPVDLGSGSTLTRFA